MGGFGIWKNSWRDVFPFALTMAQLAFLIVLALTWERWPPYALAVVWAPLLLLFWYNPIISTHNCIHNPWFRFEWMNRLYTALNSINLGTPQIIYRFQHLNHHRFENDRKDAQGKTRDHSSSFARGANGEHEGVLAYSAFGVFRNGGGPALKQVWNSRNRGQLFLETAFVLAGLSWFAALSWKFFLFYLSLFFFGWLLANMENYYEHYRANPEIKEANSISYYGRVYNFLFCNEGFHQEHHLRPQAHWTQRPKMREELKDILDHPQRRVSKYPPLLGFLDPR